MEETILAAVTRPVRVAIPVLASFCADVFTVRDFTVNLSEGGIFLPTDKLCPVDTVGSLTFRFSQFVEPFQLRGKVVRQVTPEQEKDGYASGLGIQFLDLTEQDRDRLRRLVHGVQNGSVVGAIRRGIRESKRPIELELRQRPTDQKLTLAINAQGQEITALMRERNPSRC